MGVWNLSRKGIVEYALKRNQGDCQFSVLPKDIDSFLTSTSRLSTTLNLRICRQIPTDIFLQLYLRVSPSTKLSMSNIVGHTVDHIASLSATSVVNNR